MNLRGNFYILGIATSVLWGISFGLVSAATSTPETVCTVEWPVGYDGSETVVLEDCADPFQLSTSTNYTISRRIDGDPVRSSNAVPYLVEKVPTTIKVNSVDLETYQPEYKLAIFSEAKEGEFVEQYSGVGQVGATHRLELSLPNEVVEDRQYHIVLGFQPRESSTTPNTDEKFYLSDNYDRVQNQFLLSQLDVREPPKPLGPSVLFLPGIMGSRLYADDGGCDNDSEYELWFSRDDCEQLRLQTKFTGESKHEVYTKDEDAVIDEILVQNLYQDWLDTLADWEAHGEIAAYSAIPYDWRLRLGDILQTRREVGSGHIYYDHAADITDSYIYEELDRLAGQGDDVTIVAHSNGGLLAKQLLHELEKRNDPLLNQVSEIVLIGVPQTGTPSAVVSMLHGEDILWGFVVKQEVSRQLMNTAPFAHHLLPTEEYFQSIGPGSVIDIAAGTSTDAWHEQFGGHIEEVDTMYEFLSQDSGRLDPAVDNLQQPEVVDRHLLQYAKITGNIQADWQPPTGVEVVQITGVGVDTPNRVQYFTDVACVDRGLLPWRCQAYAPKLSYRVGEVDGDGTVVRESAAAMSGPGVTSLTAVLADLGDRNGAGKVHKNFMEMTELQAYIAYRLGLADEPDYEYLLENVNPVEESYIVYRLHSPVDIVVRDAAGNQVSSTTSEIIGGHYRRYGEVQQVRVPFDRGPFDAVLQGTDDGSFTLEVEHQRGYEITERKQFTAIPVATTTQATLSGVGDGALVTDTLTLDYDGDGDGEAAFRAGARAPVSVATSTATTSPETTDESPEPEDDNTDEVVVGEVESEAQPASTGTRVRPPTSNPGGQVAGISTSTVTEEAMSYDDLYAALVALQEVLEQYEKNIVS